MIAFLLITTFILFIGYSFLLIYYRQCWRKIPYYYPAMQPALTTKITVIIPARNEEKNIGTCLRAIVAQTYPATLFEVIVVDDHSTDNTSQVVNAFEQTNIRCIFLKDFIADPINSYKKKAIEIAITQATGDVIITTDADCFMGKNWLYTIASFYQKYNPVFIAAPVIINNKTTFLSIFQGLDFMTLQGVTGAAVYNKMHNMCNGANLAYTKKAFMEVGGFSGIDTIASGDDMLLMHKIFTRYPHKVMFLKSSDAIVTTQPMESWKSFFNQRIRWASKAERYNDKSILPVLILVYFFNLLLLFLPLGASFSTVTYSFLDHQLSPLICSLALLVFKTLIELYFLFPVAIFFDRKKMLWWFPLAQPFHILYTVIAGWLGKFGSYQWKGRNVK